MDIDENAPNLGQPQQQTPFVELPGQPAWNTQTGQSNSGLAPNAPQIGPGQTIPPAAYYGVPGVNPQGATSEPTLPPRGPAPNSMPIQGTYDPVTGQFTPSQPINAYLTPPSQPLYAPPSQPMYAPTSESWTAAVPAFTQQPGATTMRKRMSWKLVTIVTSVLVILAIAGGGLALVSAQNRAAHLAASKAADALCAQLVTKDYGSVYSDMSSAGQSEYSSSQFGQLMSTLDQLEGAVSSCHQAAGAYSYTSGSASASTSLVISRATLGVLTGPLSLQKEGSVWKATALPTALLGVSPGALTAADNFCSALQSQQYSNLDPFLGSGEAIQMTAADFEVNLKLQDLFDGPVSDCKVTQLSTGNSDSTTTMTLSISRTKTQAESGHITLTGSGSSWTLSSADASILGTDYRPILVGNDFCSNLQSNDVVAAYKLFDASTQQSYSLASFESVFDVSGWSYFCGDPDMPTFTSASGTATYQLDVAEQGRDYYHTSGTFRMTLYFVEYSGSWSLDGYKLVSK